MFHGMDYIYEVYKEKSFSKAAQNLYISQPSLSATIKKIENRIGCPIFDRSTAPIRLTDCGEEYIRCVEKILGIQSGFESFLNDRNELKTGQLSIGASNLFASYILPPMISHFTQTYPQVTINLVEANTPLLEERLSAGMLDLVIDNYTFTDPAYTRYPYCLDHLVLAVPRQCQPASLTTGIWLTSKDIIENRHTMTDTPPACLSSFSHAPFLFLRSGNDTRRRAEAICQAQDFHPQIILKLDQQVTAYNLCCYGMGITFVSDMLVRRVTPDPNVVFCRLNHPDSTRNVSFFRKKGAYQTRAVEEFLRMSLPCYDTDSGSPA